MPLYEYRNPETGEIIEILQSMNSTHEYIDNNGLNWERVFFSPTSSVKGTPIDFRCPKDRKKYHEVYKKRYEYNKKKKGIK